MTHYRIVVHGELSDRFQGGFGGLHLERQEGDTVLEGEIADQAQLFGLLDRLQDLGLEVLTVNATRVG